MSGLSSFRSVRTVGTVLPAEALTRGPTNCACPARGRRAIICRRAWRSTPPSPAPGKRCSPPTRNGCTALERLPDGDAATKVTRDKWLLPLLYELGWGRPESSAAACDVPPGLGETTLRTSRSRTESPGPTPRTPPAWVPLHLVGAGIDLDTKTAAVTARAPQSMLQDYLNREDRALWAVLSNGRHSAAAARRLDPGAPVLSSNSTSTTIFTDQLYADFRLLFLTATPADSLPRLDDNAARSHRLTSEDPMRTTEVRSRPNAKLDNCWLERWRTTAIDDGARALLNSAARHRRRAAAPRHRLRRPTRPTLHCARRWLAATDADRDLHRALLRIAYRLIVLFVAEDRDLLHRSDVARECPRPCMRDYFSTARLRRLAAEPIGGWHTDLWEAHQIVTDALAGDGLPALGLSGLGASLYQRDALSILDGARATQPGVARRGAGTVADRRPGDRAAAPGRLPQPRQRRTRRHVRGTAGLHTPLPRRRAGLHPRRRPPATSARSPAPTTPPPI